MTEKGKGLIIVKHGEHNKLARLFGVSAPTIRRALRGEYTEKADRICKAALERGGRFMRESKHTK